MYGSINSWNRNVSPTKVVGCVRISKILGYENPYIVKGNIKRTGSQESPKGIYARITLLERGKLVMLRAYTL